MRRRRGPPISRWSDDDEALRRKMRGREGPDTMHFGTSWRSGAAASAKAPRCARRSTWRTPGGGRPDGVWLGEIHQRQSLDPVPPPRARELWPPAARRLARASRCRYCPLGNPLRIAEEAATVDQLSEGASTSGSAAAARRAPTTSSGCPTARARRASSNRSRSSAWPGRGAVQLRRQVLPCPERHGPHPYQVPHPGMRMAANSRRRSRRSPAWVRRSSSGSGIWTSARCAAPQDLSGSVARIGARPARRTCTFASWVYAAPTEAAARARSRGRP